MPEGIWGPLDEFAIHALASLPVGRTAEGEKKALEISLRICQCQIQPRACCLTWSSNVREGRKNVGLIRCFKTMDTRGSKKEPEG